MRKLALIFGLILSSAIPAFGQSTSVTGTITDSSGQVWANGNYSFSFFPSPINPTGPYFWAGSPFNMGTVVSGSLNSSGAFTASVPSNSVITPANSQWKITVCPQATVVTCYSTNLSITGASQNISSLVIPPPIQVNAQTVNQISAYKDAQIINPSVGTTYFNLTDSTVHVCTVGLPCTWVSLGSGGGGGSPPASPACALQLANASVTGFSTASFGGVPLSVDNCSSPTVLIDPMSLSVAGTQTVGGPNPWIDTAQYGMRAVSSAFTATANCINGSSTVTFSAGSFASFKNGDGVNLYGCGPTNALLTPPAPTVTPSQIYGPDTQHDTVPGPTGSSSYSYCLVGRDKNGGMTKCGPAGTTSTGVAPGSLGKFDTTVSTLSRSNNIVTVTTSTANNAAVGGAVFITNSTDPSFSGYFKIASVTPPFTFTYAQGMDTRYGATAGATGGTASVYNCNRLDWNYDPSVWQYYVYTTGGSFLAPVRPGENYWTDCGAASYGASVPDFVPAIAPTSATNDYLPTTITAGGGTSSITVQNAPSQNFSGTEAKFDDGPAFAKAYGQSCCSLKGGLRITTPAAGLSYFINSHQNLVGDGSAIMLGGGCLVVNETIELNAIRWTGEEGGGCVNNSTQFSWTPSQQVTVGTAYPGFTFLNPSVIDNLTFSAPAQGLIMTLSDGWGFNSQLERDNFIINGTDFTGQAVVEYGTANTVARYDLFSTNDTSGYGYSLTPLVLLKDDTPGVDPSGSFSCQHCFFVGRTWGVDNTPTGGGGAVYRFFDTYAQANRTPMIMVGSNGSDLYSLDNVIGDTSSQPYFANMAGAGMSVILVNLSNTSVEAAGRPGMVTGQPIQQLNVQNTSYLNGSVIGQNFNLTNQTGPSLCVNCLNTGLYNFGLNGPGLFQSYFDVNEIPNPGNPAAGFERWYADNSAHQFSCLNSAGGSCAPGGSGATSFQVNGTVLVSSGTVNFQSSSPFNGVTFTFTNPSSGNIQLGASGTFSNSALANPFTTVNGQTCTLGASCNVPFQTNGVNLALLAGLNLVNSTTNAAGLSVTFSNPGTNQAKAEITGTANLASNLAGCIGSAAGDACIFNGTSWTRLAGNNSGTQYLGENASGVPAWGTPAGAGNVNAPSSFTSCQPLEAINNATNAASFPAYYDVSCFSGADASVKWNACNTAAIAAGGGICDARALGGTQSISVEMDVGNSSSVPVTFILPSAGRWTATGFTGGTSSMIKQFSNTNITGDAGELKMIFQNGNGSGGLQYLYSTGASGGNCYFQSDHYTLYNPTAPTATNVGMLINLGCDNSYFKEMQVLDYQDSTAGVEVLNGACCSAALETFTSNGNYTGGPPLAVVSNSSGTVNGLSLHNVSLDHPKAGSPNFSCTDTSTAKNTTITFSGMNYEEGNNADTTTAFNQIAGCGAVTVGGMEIKAETASSTAPGFTISNSTTTAFKVGVLSMLGGGGSFTYPARAVTNSATGNIVPTDAKGNLSGYSSNDNYFDGFNGLLNTYSGAHTLTGNENWVNVTGTTTITVPHALTGQQWHVFNSGNATVTLTPDSGNISGNASAPATTLSVAANTGFIVSCDGTNCFAVGGGSGGSVGTGNQFALTDWATTGSLGSIVGNVTGQIPVAQNGAAPIFQSQGISGNTISASTPYTVQCDSSTTTLDRLKTLIFTAAAGVTVTIPDAGSTGCGNNFTVTIGAGVGAGTVTVNRSSSSSFTILNGSTATSGATTFPLQAGQYATINSQDNTNYLVRIPSFFAGGVPFSSVSSGTGTGTYNVGTGGSLAPTGSGTINANILNGVTLTGAAVLGNCIVAASSSSANWGNCATISFPATVTGGTTGHFTSFSSSTSLIVNPNLDDGQTTAHALTYADTSGFTASLGPIQAGVSGSGVGQPFIFQEGTVPVGIASKDVCYGDSTAHGVKCSFNNGSFLPIIQGGGSTNTGDLVSWGNGSGTGLADPGIVATNVVTAATAAANANQICVASTTLTKSCTYIAFPETHYIPAANCFNANPGDGWSSNVAAVCRGGTNNKGGYIPLTNSTTAQFSLPLPEDWNSANPPFIRFQISSGDTTTGHTVIPSFQVSCTGTGGTTTDDVTFNAVRSSSTITLNTTANQFWSTSNIQFNSTDMTGCAPGSLMTVQISRATDTATSANFYGATITIPRLLAVQAN